jgi:hypothetical protein
MKMKSTTTLIKEMSNKDLIRTANKIREEKEHKKQYGDYGTGRWVSSSEFWGGHHQDIRDELKRRQEKGEIKATAGKPKKAKSTNMFDEDFSFGFKPSKKMDFRF